MPSPVFSTSFPAPRTVLQPAAEIAIAIHATASINRFMVHPPGQFNVLIVETLCKDPGSLA
jgi:hypothetical protein